MKVLRIATELNYGGIEKVFELHAKHHEKTYELVFVALGIGGNTERLLQDLGYKVIILNANRVTIPSFGLLKVLARVLKDEKPDVVHTAGAEANFHATIAAKIAGVKKIINEEIGIPNHSLKAKFIFKTVYKLSSEVIAISEAVKQYLVSSGEVPSRKIRMIYNPIEAVNSKVSNNSKQGKQKFITVARLEPVKNIGALIDAFGEFVKQYPEASLHILGDGSLKGLLQKKVHDLKITESVYFLGYVSNPRFYLEESNIFVLPSLYEGFGLACIEAIQSSVVTISTNSGGIPEFITDGKDGFLFDPNNKNELLDKMRKAAQLASDEYNKMTTSAKDRVTSMFSPTTYITELKKLYFSS